MEEAIGPEINYRFKAMAQVVVLSAKLKKTEKMQLFQGKILKILDKVARNDVSEAIKNILDSVERHLGGQVAE